MAKLRLGTVIEATGAGHNEVIMSTSASTTVVGRFSPPQSPTLAQLDRGPRFEPVQNLNGEKPFSAKTTEPVRATPTEISFGPFRLFPAQFLLLEGEKQVPLVGRALEVLIILLQRPGELITKQELMARVWPDVSVEPANLSVHISALRRT